MSRVVGALVLAVGADGPRIAFTDFDSTGSTLYLYECHNGCLTAQSWALIPLYEVDIDSEIGLAIDVEGRAHLAFTSAITDVGYAFCTTDCSHQQGWTGVVIHTTDYLFGHAGIDLALDVNRNPILAVGDDTDTIALRCTSDCETPTSAWSYIRVDSEDDFRGDVGDDPLPLCSQGGTPAVDWEPSLEGTTLALDASGTLHIATAAGVAPLCIGGNEQYPEILPSVRYAQTRF